MKKWFLAVLYSVLIIAAGLMFMEAPVFVGSIIAFAVLVCAVRYGFLD